MSQITFERYMEQVAEEVKRLSGHDLDDLPTIDVDFYSLHEELASSTEAAYEALDSAGFFNDQPDWAPPDPEEFDPEEIGYD